LYHGDLII